MKCPRQERHRKSRWASSVSTDKDHNYLQFSPMQWEDNTNCTEVLGEVGDTIEEKIVFNGLVGHGPFW